MNTIKFNIIPSPESNDHQVRIIIDSEDWLKDEYLGIDPPRFFQQDTFINGGLLVGRCHCGVDGCSDLIVHVRTDNASVFWENNAALKLQFDKLYYLSQIDKSRKDVSWEDIKRRVERLILNKFVKIQTIDGLTFDWASCRIEDNKVCLSFSKKGSLEDFKQEILKFDWDGTTENDALDNADRFLLTNKRLKK